MARAVSVSELAGKRLNRALRRLNRALMARAVSVSELAGKRY
jgi:hypothetical protein